MRSRWGAKINQYSEPPKLQSPLKPESGSWQNSWWIGLMSEEWNKTQHMSEPEVLGLCVIVPRWMPCVHLEGAAALLHSQPHKVTFKNYCRTIKRFDSKMYFSLCLLFPPLHCGLYPGSREDSQTSNRKYLRTWHWQDMFRHLDKVGQKVRHKRNLL